MAFKAKELTYTNSDKVKTSFSPKIWEVTYEQDNPHLTHTFVMKQDSKPTKSEAKEAVLKKKEISHNTVAILSFAGDMFLWDMIYELVKDVTNTVYFTGAAVRLEVDGAKYLGVFKTPVTVNESTDFLQLASDNHLHLVKRPEPLPEVEIMEEE